MFPSFQYLIKTISSSKNFLTKYLTCHACHKPAVNKKEGLLSFVFSMRLYKMNFLSAQKKTMVYV